MGTWARLEIATMFHALYLQCAGHQTKQHFLFCVCADCYMNIDMSILRSKSCDGVILQILFASGYTHLIEHSWFNASFLWATFVLSGNGARSIHSPPFILITHSGDM